MCKRISWIKTRDGTLLYLTAYDIFDTPQGKSLREQHTAPEDWWGHASIKLFHGRGIRENLGAEHECTDFSAPNNFPSEIAQAIKDGKFWDVIDENLLTGVAWTKWLKMRNPVSKTYAAYEKARAAYEKAWAVYNKTYAARDKAYAAYEKAWVARDKAYAAYEKARAVYNKTYAARDKAYAARDKAWAARDKARAARDKARAANPIGDAVGQRAFWKLFSVKNNRAKAWR